MHLKIAPDGSYLTLLQDGKPIRFHAVWLRDNALDAETRSPDNGQRLITLLDQPPTSLIESATWLDSDTLHIRFQDNPQDYHYPLNWLLANSYDHPAPKQSGWTNTHLKRWGHELQSHIPAISYPQAKQDKTAFIDWLAAIRRYGFATMNDLPEDPEALLEVTELFGFVRETNYGRFFDVRSEVNPVNLAYTGLGLQAHTDNPYRDPVPTMQILSCIENTTDSGESIVVDGFQVAAILQQEDAAHFDLLTQYNARFRYAGSADTDLSSKRPMIELGPDGELLAIRFNNRSAAPFTDIPFDVMPQYYQAYRHFTEIIERPENRVSFKLQAGELFIVDNTRVMHSRTAFSGSGTRWLRGCYPDKDGLLSTLAVLESQHPDRKYAWPV